MRIDRHHHPVRKRLAATGGSLDTRDGQGRTPLMVAAFQRHVEAARALIQAGADLNLLDNARSAVRGWS